ncbi:MAG: helix-turn-helix domain-containing protein [Acidobacteriota bacterium]
MPSRRRIHAFRAAAILLGTLAGLALVEGGARVIVALRYQRGAIRPTRAKGGHLELLDLLRPSHDSSLVFLLKPHLRGTFAGVSLETNDAGFRDRPRAEERPEGVFRIAILGDSIAFGWGVPAQDRLSDRLESFLGATARAGARYEVPNFAVPAYNTVQEARLLETIVERYRPQVVVVQLCFDNDARLPNFMARPPKLWSPTTCFACNLLRGRNFKGATPSWGLFRVKGLWENPPPELAHLAGWDHLWEAMARIGSEALGDPGHRGLLQEKRVKRREMGSRGRSYPLTSQHDNILFKYGRQPTPPRSAASDQKTLPTLDPERWSMASRQRTKEPKEPIGVRLSRLRRERGITQEELAQKLGLAQANISDYERGVYPFRGSDLIVKWSAALGLSTDETLGVKPSRDGMSPKAARLVKRLGRVADLPPGDQRAVLKFVDALVASRGLNGDGQHATRKLSSATR